MFCHPTRLKFKLILVLRPFNIKSFIFKSFILLPCYVRIGWTITLAMIEEGTETITAIAEGHTIIVNDMWACFFFPLRLSALTC